MVLYDHFRFRAIPVSRVRVLVVYTTWLEGLFRVFVTRDQAYCLDLEAAAVSRQTAFFNDYNPFERKPFWAKPILAKLKTWFGETEIHWSVYFIGVSRLGKHCISY